MPRFTSSVNQKFNEDGSIRTFRGNTFICKVPPQDPVFQTLIEVQDRYKNLACASKFSFLPPASFHMTVMEGVCEDVRDRGHWIRELPVTASLEEATQYIASRTESVEPVAPFRMKFMDMSHSFVILFNLDPVDDEAEVNIKAYREVLSSSAGLRFPDHDDYFFHITLAYKIIELEPDEEQEIDALRLDIRDNLLPGLPVLELNDPRFVVFNDMADF